MEFVLVEYPISRAVRRNTRPFGFTQTVLQCRPGLHDFDLASPKDYTPLTQKVSVRDTSPGQPMRIRFTPLTAAFITLPAAAAPPPPAAQRRKAAMKAKRKPRKKPARPRARQKAGKKNKKKP